MARVNLDFLASELPVLLLERPGEIILRGIGFSKKDIEKSDGPAYVAGLFGWAIVALFAVIVWAVFFRAAS